MSQNVTQGQDITLSCKASSIYQQINVIWLKGNVNIGNYGTTNAVGESLLTLRSVSRNDVGWYHCRFSNPGGLNESQSAYIDVFGNSCISFTTSLQFDSMRIK